MTRPVNAASANETTDFAGNYNDPYRGGVQGVGIPVSCRNVYNVKLTDQTSQFDTVAMAVATTLMALVPTLLSFSPLPTAEIKSLLYFNTEIALLSAAMTLGLYNKGTSTMRKRYLRNAKEMIEAVSTRDKGEEIPAGIGPVISPEIDPEKTRLLSYYPKEKPQPTIDKSTPVGSTTAELTAGDGDGDGITFETVQSMAIQGHGKRPRRIKIAIIVFWFGLLQITLFGILVRGLPMIDDIQFIWACQKQSLSYFTWWLGGTAVASGLIRTFASSSTITKSEAFQLRPLLDDAGDLIDMEDGCKDCSIFRRGESNPRRGFGIAFKLFIYDIYHFLKIVFHPKGTATTADPSKMNPEATVTSITIGPVLRRLRSILRNLNSNHAMVVVLRDSQDWISEQQSPIYPTFLGYTQAVILIFLTFLFGSAWDGTLFYTMAFVFGFLTVITGSRVLSLSICRWMETKLNMVIIECERDGERDKIRKILLAMPGVLVESTTESYKYAGGYRFDTDVDTMVYDTEEKHIHTYSDQIIVGRPHQWRAIGVGFGILVGLASWVGGAVVFYIASVPANEPFFPGASHVRSDTQILGAYFIPSICVSAILGFVLAFAFGVKVRTEFGALIIGEDVPKKEGGA